MNSYRVKEMNDFFDDKRRLTTYLARLSSGEKPAYETLRSLIATSSRWRSHPPLYRTIQEDVAILKELATKTEYQQQKKLLQSSPSLPDSQVAQQSHPNQLLSIVPSAQKTHSSPIISPKQSAPREQIVVQQPFSPSSSLIHAFYDVQGLVGEYENRELLIYGALSKTHIGIESIAGSGKSALLYAFLKAIHPDEYFTIHQSTAKAFYNNPSINRARIWVIPELQKIFSHDVEEIIKNLTEGVSITHARTNKNRDGVDTFEITPKTIFYSFAITNKHLKYRDDEFYRRFVILHTDLTREQNMEVATQYAKADFCAQQPTSNSPPLLQSHLQRCLASNATVKNPFMEGVLDAFPREIKSHVRFKSSVKYLQALTKGRTTYMQSDHTRSPMLFSTLDDALHTLSLYQHTLVMNLHGINAIEAGVLALLEQTPGGMPLPLLQQQFRETYSAPLPCNDLVDRLCARDLVQKDAEQFFLLPVQKIDISLDDLLKKASALMKREYPSSHDQWYASCLNEGECIWKGESHERGNLLLPARRQNNE